MFKLNGGVEAFSSQSIPANGEVIKIYRRVSNGQGGWTAWKEYKTTTISLRPTINGQATGTKGIFDTTAYAYTLDTQFKAVFKGNAKLFGSESKPITITGFGVD